MSADVSAAPPSKAIQSRVPSFRPGAIIADKYVVERLIGEGGVGVVVAAKHVQLEQLVAIKYLRSRAFASESVAERFVNEARLAAKIRSDHVARVYDVGTLPSGVPYMVMEYLSGMDLGRMLGAMGPLPVWRAVDYVLQACEALGAAHAAGIVHRDIKPENLFVTTGASGTPLLKVLDFGISKLTCERARVESGQGGEVTVSGELFGTPAYMSPEQLLAAEEVDGRTDIWAIGVVLFQLLSGRLPFDGESLADLCAAIVNKHPLPLSDVRADVPQGLARSVERCLAKARGDRYPTVADLRVELAPFAVATRQQRVSQALRTLEAADQGRPPTPLPDELLTRALRAAPVPSFEDDRWVATTGSGVATHTPAAIDEVQVHAAAPRPRRLRKRQRQALAVAATCAVGAALIVAAAMGGRPDRVASQPGPAQRTAPAPDPPTLPSTSIETAIPTATATATPTPTPTPTPTSTSIPPATTTPTSTPPARRPAPVPAPERPVAQSHPAASHEKPAPSASASGHPALTDPNAVINPFD